MSSHPVQAIFCWRYSQTVFRATYGRFPGTLYSKDFLQCAIPQLAALDRVFGRTGTQTIDVQYRWPGGQAEGELRRAPDGRGQLSWRGGPAPKPWRLGDPATDPSVIIPGNPNRDSEATAEQERENLEGSNLRPWIIAVKLRNTESVLHVRTALTNPPIGMENWGVACLPQILRDTIAHVPANHDGGFYELTGTEQFRCPELAQHVLTLLESEPNVLLVGPPGTGKSVVLEDLRAFYEGRISALAFDQEKADDPWTEIPGALGEEESKVIPVVFHPSYGYEEFVAGLVPKTTQGTMNLVARPGPLLSLAHWAQDVNRRALITIDEFNRGAAAAIFGDTLALLDGEKRARAGQPGAKIQRPHSLDSMAVEETYARADGTLDLPPIIDLPAGLHIVAAQNSTDRSVAPLDAALRRRFAIVQVPPSAAVLAKHLGIAGVELSPFAPSAPDPAQWQDRDIKALAVHVLIALNERIAFILGEDFCLGHALLWSVCGDSTAAAARSLADAFQHRILMTLRLTFADQDENLAGVLKVPVAGNTPGVTVAAWRPMPPDLAALAAPRLQVTDMAALAQSDWAQAMKRLQALL